MEKNTECFICKDNEIEEKLISLCNCSLVYHESCLMQWIIKKKYIR